MLLIPGRLTLDDLQALHVGGVQLELDPAAWPAVEASAAVVRRAAAGTEPVYGVNTGFGKLASTRIGAEDLAALQRTLIRSHSVGVAACGAVDPGPESGQPGARPLGRAVSGDPEAA